MHYTPPKLQNWLRVWPLSNFSLQSLHVIFQWLRKFAFFDNLRRYLLTVLKLFEVDVIRHSGDVMNAEKLSS